MHDLSISKTICKVVKHVLVFVIYWDFWNAHTKNTPNAAKNLEMLFSEMYILKKILTGAVRVTLYNSKLQNVFDILFVL